MKKNKSEPYKQAVDIKDMRTLPSLLKRFPHGKKVRRVAKAIHSPVITINVTVLNFIALLSMCK